MDRPPAQPHLLPRPRPGPPPALPHPRPPPRPILGRLFRILPDPRRPAGSATVGETAQRTGLPQSQVSTAVARLREAGSVRTAPDPADRQAPEVSDRVAAVRAAGSSKVEEALARGPGRHRGRPPP
ncbi:helix-turn-helix domain-containing protein [Streptomyces sp. NPDC046866]|uniref:MarR family transcriptional regulator n=1 Tax=Streptomyces sp. NPDC046866 TaxID=3154921 RepID=UPI0034556F51